MGLKEAWNNSVWGKLFPANFYDENPGESEPCAEFQGTAGEPLYIRFCTVDTSTDELHCSEWEEVTESDTAPILDMVNEGSPINPNETFRFGGDAFGFNSLPTLEEIVQQVNRDAVVDDFVQEQFTDNTVNSHGMPRALDSLDSEALEALLEAIRSMLEGNYFLEGDFGDTHQSSTFTLPSNVEPAGGCIDIVEDSTVNLQVIYDEELQDSQVVLTASVTIGDTIYSSRQGAANLTVSSNLLPVLEKLIGELVNEVLSGPMD